MSIFNPIYETKKRKGLLGKKNRKQNYKRYLQTKAWKKTRNKIRRDRKVCERCGDNKNLQVHHKNYDRAGGEVVADLELLCEQCHKRNHGIRQLIIYDIWYILFIHEEV